MKFLGTTPMKRDGVIIGLIEELKIKDSKIASFSRMMIPGKMNFNVFEDIFKIKSEEKTIECKVLTGSVCLYSKEFILVEKGTIIYDMDLTSKF